MASKRSWRFIDLDPVELEATMTRDHYPTAPFFHHDSRSDSMHLLLPSLPLCCIAVSLEHLRNPNPVRHGWPCQEYKTVGDIALGSIRSSKHHHHCRVAIQGRTKLKQPTDDSISLQETTLSSNLSDLGISVLYRNSSIEHVSNVGGFSEILIKIKLYTSKFWALNIITS